MSELPTAQKNRLESWATQAIEQGWLNEDAKHLLDTAGNANPGQLFNQQTRPLVAGLFGGTGVGKSTLLNRLAGDDIARASAERPTSRIITVYVHRSVSVDRLPDNLPMERMRTAMHSNDDYRQIMFIDMPDFDSVEQANRELVDLWLPHLDVVLYVVSPERYRDDQGWQLLLRHATEHAWLFVINQWDRGDPEQREDFIRQLNAQGLSDPLVFCTDCATPAHAPGADPSLASDDFLSLQSTLLSLSDNQIVSALQDQGVLARLQKLKHTADSWLEPLSDEQTLQQLTERWTAHADKQHPGIIDALHLSTRQLAQTHGQSAPFWRRLLGAGLTAQKTDQSLLDNLGQSLNERLENLLDSFINQQAHELQMPMPAIRGALHEPHQQILENSEHTLAVALSRALMSPGKPWQRMCHKAMSVLSLGLPLASLAWISYRVVAAFAAGGSDTGAYLGSSFAVNGALLLGVSWLLPALVATWVRPTAEQAAEQGLLQGIEHVLQNSLELGEKSLTRLTEQASGLRADYQQLWAELPQDNTAQLPDAVRRMLMAQIVQTPERKLDVRANTHSSTDTAPVS